MPTLVVHGTEDRILPIDSTARRLPDLIADCTLIEIDDGPHNICWTHAGVAAVIICSYVPIGGSGPPRTAAGGCVIPVACDAGTLKSIVRT